VYMRKNFAIVLYIVFSGAALAQEVNTNKEKKAGSIPIYISFNKSIQLVFDSEIIDMDIGSSPEDVIILPGNEKRKLKVKAGLEGFEDTNLIVETRDGYYSFLVRYQADINKFLYLVGRDDANLQKKVNEDAPMENVPVYTDLSKEEVEELERNCLKIEKKVSASAVSGAISKKMVFLLYGVYVRGDYLYISYSLENTSNIRYDIDFFRYVIKDKKGKSKKATVMEDDIYPVYVKEPADKLISPKSKYQVIAIFRKFTLSSNGYLGLEAWEIEGSRNLSIKISNKMILNAERL